MTYGAILMVLALFKSAEYWKMAAGFKGFPLVKILIRDQALYFLLYVLYNSVAAGLVLTLLRVVSYCVLNIVGFRLVPSNAFVSNILITLGSPALLTILGSRMLFNLKEAAELGLNEGTNARITSRTVSAMDFADRESAKV